jgi:hypothetical protein
VNRSLRRRAAKNRLLLKGCGTFLSLFYFFAD